MFFLINIIKLGNILLKLSIVKVMKGVIFVNNKEKQAILLESGTNELEVIEFGIGDGIFGINVMKVREIVNPLQVVKMPNTHPCMKGIIQLRGEVMPVIDLAAFLNYPPSETAEQDKVIVTEFNLHKVAFHVHSVSRIHRISWEQIEKPSEITQTNQACTIGVIKMDEKLILLLDFEKIIVELSPEMSDRSEAIRKMGHREESNKRIVITEDSPMIRKLLLEYLPEIGYTKLEFFQNGAEAWKYLENLAETKGEDFIKEINLLISDIEMPQMDGHHLTKKIKNHKILRKLPVVIFSSLITDELRHKGEQVGADAQISKPQYVELSNIIDQLIL